jgi:hypothetical protein
MENLASEKIRIDKVIKENASSFLAIGGFVWLIYSLVITPIQRLEYSVGDILNNHLKTIQDEQVTATAERKSQTEQLNLLSNEITKLTTILEQQGEITVK